MDKEKETQKEMIGLVMANCNSQGRGKLCPERIGMAFFQEGYRKADEVRKETAKEILMFLKSKFEKELAYKPLFMDFHHGISICKDIVEKCSKEHGVEVDAEKNRCVSCGAVIPEGRQVCPSCENKNGGKQWKRNY